MRFLFSALFLYAVPLYAQITTASQPNFEAYVFEENNRGYLNQVKVNVYDIRNNSLVAELVTDPNGKVAATLPSGATYRVFSRKDIFIERNDTLSIAAGQMGFLKIELQRKPGYLFDVTLAEVRDKDAETTDAIDGARLEIYNNTQKKLELVNESLPGPYFQFTFEQGNYYTILIRKEGYMARRIEAHVNIDGCIICIDGVNNLRPGVTDNLTAGLSMGTLLANIDMVKSKVGQKLVNHIYYKPNSTEITPVAASELDKLVTMMKANPELQFELGSHTDARGNDIENLDLSRRRAEAAVAYIIEKGIEKERIWAKGYGENYITNKCKNGVACSEDEHAVNRRTEMKVLGVFTDSKVFVPLTEIIRLEAIEKARAELIKEEVKVVKIQADEKDKAPIQIIEGALPVKIKQEDRKIAPPNQGNE